MKWPVGVFRGAVHEFVCYFWGHNWRPAARIKVRNEEPPHWTQSTLGNPYFETVSSWEAKCRRCRFRTAERDYGGPWYKTLYWAMVASGRTMLWAVEFSAKDTRFPGSLVGVLAAPIHGAVQFLSWLVLDFRLPLSWLLSLMADAEYWIYGWQDKYLKPTKYEPDSR